MPWIGKWWKWPFIHMHYTHNHMRDNGIIFGSTSKVTSFFFLFFPIISIVFNRVNECFATWFPYGCFWSHPFCDGFCDTFYQEWKHILSEFNQESWIAVQPLYPIKTSGLKVVFGAEDFGLFVSIMKELFFPYVNLVRTTVEENNHAVLLVDGYTLWSALYFYVLTTSKS